MPAQPSLLRQWQSRFKATVASYLKAKADLDEYRHNVNEGHRHHDEDEAQQLRDRERMLRGVVRGGAQMLIILTNPWSWKNNEAILDLEIDYGMPGKRSKPRPGVSPTMSKFLEDNR